MDNIYTQKPFLFLWTPVFVAIGIGVYFFLPTEPSLILGLSILTALAALAFAARDKTVLYIPLIGLILIALGFTSAQIRTRVIHTPIVQDDIGPVTVQGRILAIEDQDETASRLLLGDLIVEDLPPSETPRKVRLRIRDDTGLRPGQRVEVLGQLHKPSAPVIPGGFDFQRYLYFQGIGAIGFIYKDAKILDDTGVSPVSTYIETLRQKVAHAAEHYMDYPQAGIAMALMMGRQTAIDDEHKEIMRSAGLAHILAVSGLHVGLFSGVVFFIVRFLMACFPAFALKHPIKKYAAVLGIIAATTYMMLAGANIPAQRALIMTTLVFLAIILDRSPISLRLVAFAALTVLLLFPESLLSASFHLSFAAVTALITFYDRLRPVWSAWHRQAGPIKRLALYFTGVCLTSVIATCATAPFALFHFNRLALYGLISNMVCVPLLAFWIMPVVVLSLFLLPLGLAEPAFWLMEQGLHVVIMVATWVASLPHAVLLVPSWPLLALICMVCGALWIILWTGRWKVLGLIPVLASAFFIHAYKAPDILIASDIKLAGIYDHNKNTLSVSTLRRGRFVSENWAQSYGVSPDDLQKWPREYNGGAILCDERACRIDVKGIKAAYIQSPAVINAECAAVDIVISQIPLPTCETAVNIDIRDTKHQGSHAIWIEPDKHITFKSSEDLRGNRPWSGLNHNFRL